MAIATDTADIRRVALFIPCLVDTYLPEVGEAVVRLLRHLGLQLTYDHRQTCCGQPAFNAGHREHARRLTVRAIRLFARAEVDAVVAPSGSCVSMLRRHAGELDLSAEENVAWQALRPRLFELTELLAGPLALRSLPGRYPRRVAYHESCHLARELGVREAPQRLLRSLEGLEWVPLRDADVCCGFGGTFSTRNPELSVAMGRSKLAALLASGAEELVLGDAGCLLQVRGTIEGSGVTRVRVRHVAEVLADAVEAAA